jgi:hypothetical protein
VNTWVPSRVSCWVQVVHLFSFLCCVVFVFVLCLVCPNLSATYLAIFTILIFICVHRLSRDVKNSCNLLQRHSYIRTKCLSIFTRPTWTNDISPLSRRQTIIVLVGLLLLMILLHILTQPCSGCYLFIFWHRLIISGMKVCYYQTVGEVASLPCDHWSQGQIDFCGHFRVQDVTFFYLLT